MSLSIQKVEEDSGLRFILGGSLNTETYKQLEEVLLPECEGSRKIILDLGELKYLTSLGIRVIFAAAKKLQAGGGQLIVAKAQPQIRKVFQIIGDLPQVKLFRDDQELDQYLMNIQRKQVDP